MTTTLHARVSVILVVGCLFGPGCARKKQEAQPKDAPAAIVCPQLYQGTASFADALAFVEVPQDRMESSLASVTRRGQLARGQQLVFANKLFRAFFNDL